MIGAGKRRRLLVIVTALLCAGWLASSWGVTWSLSRRPHPQGPEPVPAVDWATLEELTLPTADGETIGAWLIPGDEAQPCVVLTHGWRMSRSRRLPLIEWLARRGCTVLAITLRTHGDSTGDVNDFGWSGRHDIIAAVEHLERTFPERPIVVLGQSLGAAAALFAADALDSRVAGYFLEQPYKDLATATWCRLQAQLPPGFDLLAYSGMRLCAPVILPVRVDDLCPCRHAADIPADTPVMIITGASDAHARLEDVRQVFECVASHGELVAIDGAGHVDLHAEFPAEFEAALARFLIRVADRVQ